MAFGLGGFLHKIQIKFTGKNELTGPVKKAVGDLNKLKKFAKGMKSIGKKMMFGGALMGAALTPGILAAKNFETAMREVSTLVDTSKVDMGSLGKTVKDLSAEFGSMPVDTAKGMYQTISAGFAEAGDASKVMTTGLKLAKGGVTDTFTAVDGLTSLLNAYGMRAERATEVSDSMFVAMKMGKTTIGALAGSLGQVAPLAKAAGVSMDEMNATVATLTLGGLSTSEAVTALRGMLTAVIKPIGKATKEAKSLGIEFNTAAIKSMGFASWLKQLQEKTKGSDVPLGKLFGPVRGLQGALSLLGSQGTKLTEILGEMGNKTGATEAAYAKMSKTMTEAFARMKAKMSVAAINIFTPLIPTLEKIANVVGGIADRFAGFAEAHPTIAKLGVGLFALAAVLLTVGGAFLFITGQMIFSMAMIKMWTLQTGISTGVSWSLVGALKAVGLAFYAALGPVGLIILGVAALVAGFVLLYKKSETFRKIIHGIGSALKTGFLYAFEKIKAVLMGIGRVLKIAFGNFLTVMRVFGKIFTGDWAGAWDLIQGLCTKAWDGIKAGWKMLLTWLMGLGGVFIKAGQWIFSFLSDAFSGAWANIKGMFSAIWGGITGIWTRIIDWITGLKDRFVQAGKNLIMAIVEGIKSAWVGLKAGVIGLFKKLIPFMPESDAQEGPLSRLTKSGQSFTKTFTAGVTKESPALVEEAKRTFAAASPENVLDIPGRLGGRAGMGRRGGQVSFSVTLQPGAIQIYPQTMDDAEDQLEERMNRIFQKIANNFGDITFEPVS